MTSFVDPKVERPAVRAKGTVRPSEKPRMMSRKRPSKVLDFLDDDEALSEDGSCWRGHGPAAAVAVMEELVRQERMLRIEPGRVLCGSYSEGGRSAVVGLGPRSGDVSGDEVMVFAVGRVGDVFGSSCDCGMLTL